MRTFITLTIAATVALAGCGGGGSARVTTEEIQDRVDQLTQADPVFLGSEVLIIHDGGTERTDTSSCDVDVCSIEDHDTTIEDLLFATGFQHVATRRGVSLGRGTLQHFEGEVRRWGGWISGSAFAVHSGILVDGPTTEHIIHSYSVGVPSGTNPTKGKASWSGMMVGADIRETSTTGDFVQGDATVTVSFTDATVDIVFDNIANLVTGATYADLEWDDIALVDGSFDDGTIEGQFYDLEHEEVGGIFERANILGAFGASR